MMEMMQDLMSFTPFSYLEDNLSYKELDSIINLELKERGVNSKVVFAVFNQFNEPVIYNDEMRVKDIFNLSSSEHRIPLMHHEFAGPKYYLSMMVINKKTLYFTRNVRGVIAIGVFIIGRYWHLLFYYFNHTQAEKTIHYQKRFYQQYDARIENTYFDNFFGL
jgi:hypothetical protein